MVSEQDSKKTDNFERFLELEEQAKVFDIEIDGIPIWELVRHSVYRDLKQSLGIEGQAHTSSGIESMPRRYLHAFNTLAKSSLTKNPFLSGNHDILVYGHERRKQPDDGLWWDLYFDPIYEELDLDYVHLEKQYQNGHLTPAKTNNLRYLDFINNLSRLWRKTSVNLPGVDEEELEKVTDIENAIESVFGVNLDVKGRVKYKLELRQPLRRLHSAMLKRINPEIALLVVSYGRETFIKACKKMDIPVVELQHGVIHPQHLGYAYPGDRTKETFPDYLLVWGDYWKKAVEYPIPDERVIPVGYPHLEQSVEQYEDVVSRDQILFISQGTIGEQLSKFALEVHEHPDINHDIVYKPHPGEYDRWKEEYPWLVDADFEVVDSPERQLYPLFAESSVQVGVGSTAVYEGLCFDLETYVYDCAGSQILRPLVEEGAATEITSVEELASTLGKTKTTFKRSDYFEPNATKKVCEKLTELIDLA